MVEYQDCKEGRTIKFRVPIMDRIKKLPLIRYFVAKYVKYKVNKYINRANPKYWERAIETEISNMRSKIEKQREAERKFLKQRREAILRGDLRGDLATTISKD